MRSLLPPALQLARWLLHRCHILFALLGQCPPWILFSPHAWDRKVSDSLRKETHRSLTPVRPSLRGRSGCSPGFLSPGTRAAAAPRSLQGIVVFSFFFFFSVFKYSYFSRYFPRSPSRDYSCCYISVPTMSQSIN